MAYKTLDEVVQKLLLPRLHQRPDWLERLNITLLITAGSAEAGAAPATGKAAATWTLKLKPPSPSFKSGAQEPSDFQMFLNPQKAVAFANGQLPLNDFMLDIAACNGREDELYSETVNEEEFQNVVRFCSLISPHAAQSP